MVGAGAINLVNAKNILIENNTINDCQQSSGIRASGENIVFRNNSISKVGRTGINFSNSHQSQIVNNTICNILGVHGNAISTYQCNSDVLIAGNMVYDSTRDFTFEGDAEYPGFLNNIIIYNNIFLGGGSSSWGNITGITVLNNIFASGLTINRRDKDIVIKNNIIGGLGIEGENIDISHNLYTALSWAQHSKYGWSLSEGEMIEEPDKVYVDIYNNDCHSVATNPGISAGTDVTGYLPLELFPDYDFFKDKDGNPRTTGSEWDIGPFEFQETDDPTAIISYSSLSGELTGYEPFKIIFDGSNSVSPVESIVTYDWDFGDGTVASGVCTQHVFSSGQYIVKLTVTDKKGNKNTASRKLIILASEFPNLYLYLPFDTDCLDASGKNMTVTSSDSLLFERSTYGRTIRFNNNESRSISVNHSDYLDGFDEATIAFLAKKDYAGTAATVIHKHTVYSIQITEDGLSGSFSTDSGSKTFSVASVVDDTDWHHYAVTYDGSDIVLYIDGIECSRTECTGKIKSDSSRSIMIGRDPWGDSFEGLMDEIRIYDRALSEDEIGQIMEGEKEVMPSPTPTSVPSPTPTQGPSPTPTQGPSPTPTQGPSPTPTQGPNPTPTQSPGSSGGSTPAPTKKPTPSITPEPTKAPTQKQKPNDDPALTENLITTDYPEMVSFLELLYESAAIHDNSLNPTYGEMMKRGPVISLTTGYQEQLREMAKLTFRDVRGDEWYASYIPMAVYRKLIKGFPDGTFKGGNLISRAEVLTILARFNNSEELIKQKAEQDMRSWIRLAEQIGNDWYTHYVVAAKDGLVYPDLYTRETILQPMTRGEVIYALANYLWPEDIREGGKYYTLAKSNEKPAFNDTLKTIYISNPDEGNDGPKCYCWYKQLMDVVENPEEGVPMDFYPSIICLKDKGILRGNNGDSKWNDPITRAEVLALFERLAKVWGEESH
jgi:hypothetical protein